jgi:hypothetical protein
MEQLPESGERPPLQYDEGWAEILSAPDAIDYQHWMSGLVELARLHPDIRAYPLESVRYAWQRSIEAVAEKAIPEQDKFRYTESEIIETALMALHANVQAIGWLEEGVSFMVPDLKEGSVAGIDIRTYLAEPFA